MSGRSLPISFNTVSLRFVIPIEDFIFWGMRANPPNPPIRSLFTRLLPGLNVLFDSRVFPQIAGSYRGSYFSKVGLLITEIAAAPSLPSSFVSLHLSPCMLITEIAAAPSLPSSFVSLHLSPCMSPCMLISKISLLHLSPFLCLPAC